MKDKKTQGVGVRINEVQLEALQKIIDAGHAKTISSAIQYCINKHIVLGA